jgi:hypothetical protein
MNEHQASRTLLKSPPELWAECSDAQSLARHLDTYFGEIRITRAEPESTVAWEGERASGTVKLEPSGWGTRVTLTCSTAVVEERAPEPEPLPSGQDAPPEPQPATIEPDPVLEPDTASAAGPSLPEPSGDTGRGRLFARVMRLLAPQRPVAGEPAAASGPEPTGPEPTAAEAPAPEPPPSAPEPSTPQPAEPDETTDRLAAALDSLGQAHHRPFSRA